jgi:hypothetical protein
VSDTLQVGELPDRWRAKAAELERYAPTVAAALEDAAVELERALTTGADDLLTLGQAAAASGYSTDHLSRLLREGKLPNVGRAHAPRIRRADLPRKPSRLPRPHPTGHVLGADPRQVARAVATREGLR